MSCNPIIMQGDSYYLSFNITVNNEEIDLSTINSIQFVVGDLIKYYNNDDTGEVTYNDETKTFLFPLSQQETFNITGTVESQIRIKFTDNTIVGKYLGSINIQESLTEVEI